MRTLGRKLRTDLCLCLARHQGLGLGEEVGEEDAVVLCTSPGRQRGFHHFGYASWRGPEPVARSVSYWDSICFLHFG